MEQIKFLEMMQLEALRAHPILLYAAPIGDDSVRIVYELLQEIGKTEHLGLVLSTVGGNVTTTRQLAFLLREYTQHLTIFVPYRAWSAGTLLCLCADELVLGPLAELGPIDPQVGSATQAPSGAPGMISAQDIRMFPEMAAKWFGVIKEEDQIQLLALVAQRIFPSSLTTFYRYDQMVQEIGNELLSYQCPTMESDAREKIVQKLVRGYYSHDYIISRRDAQQLGLNVVFPSSQEERVIWSLMKTLQGQLAEHPGEDAEETIGIIASTTITAREISSWMDVRSSNGEKNASMRKKRHIYWKIDMYE
jgi:Serine dehydrogenase proteinase